MILIPGDVIGEKVPLFDLCCKEDYNNFLHQVAFRNTISSCWHPSPSEEGRAPFSGVCCHCSGPSRSSPTWARTRRAGRRILLARCFWDPSVHTCDNHRGFEIVKPSPDSSIIGSLVTYWLTDSITTRHFWKTLLRDLWTLRHVMRRHDLTNKRTMTKTMITFLTIGNNNLNIHRDPWIKSDEDSIRNYCDVSGLKLLLLIVNLTNLECPSLAHQTGRWKDESILDHRMPSGSLWPLTSSQNARPSQTVFWLKVMTKLLKTLQGHKGEMVCYE